MIECPKAVSTDIWNSEGVGYEENDLHYSGGQHCAWLSWYDRRMAGCTVKRIHTIKNPFIIRDERVFQSVEKQVFRQTGRGQGSPKDKQPGLVGVQRYGRDRVVQ